MKRFLIAMSVLALSATAGEAQGLAKVNVSHNKIPVHINHINVRARVPVHAKVGVHAKVPVHANVRANVKAKARANANVKAKTRANTRTGGGKKGH